MKTTSKLLGALIAGCASVSLASVAPAASCDGPVVGALPAESSASCSNPTRKGIASFQLTGSNNADGFVDLNVGTSAIARLRDGNGHSVFCGTTQIAPIDTVPGIGNVSANADLSDCNSTGLPVVSVSVRVLG